MTNRHHPFTYDLIRGQINMSGAMGDEYAADVWRSMSGRWQWSAWRTNVGGSTVRSSRGPGLATEAEAVDAAVAWLRARCVETYGACG